MKRFVVLILSALLLALALIGCGSDDTIQTCIVANDSYMEQSALEAAVQPEYLSSDRPLYASVHFIESPKGMEYTAKWYLDGVELKTETKATQKAMQDIIVFELEEEQAAAGALRVEIRYQDTVLLSKELLVK